MVAWEGVVLEQGPVMGKGYFKGRMLPHPAKEAWSGSRSVLECLTSWSEEFPLVGSKLGTTNLLPISTAQDLAGIRGREEGSSAAEG